MFHLTAAAGLGVVDALGQVGVICGRATAAAAGAALQLSTRPISCVGLSKDRAVKIAGKTMQLGMAQ